MPRLVEKTVCNHLKAGDARGTTIGLSHFLSTRTSPKLLALCTKVSLSTFYSWFLLGFSRVINQLFLSVRVLFLPVFNTTYKNNYKDIFNYSFSFSQEAL
jgi:hypothetical protein